MTTRPPPHCWPREEHALLLQAALLTGDDALQAWTRWRSTADVERLDEGAKRLLPLLSANLDRLGVQDAVLARFVSLRRQVFFVNTARIAEAAGVLRLLESAAIDTIVLKGAALVSLNYPSRGLRPKADVAVLVPTAKRRAAVAALQGAGWTPDWRVPDDTLSVMHALAFRDRAGRELDLHWHVFMECCDEDADDDFWAAAVPVTIGGASTRTLSPADHLLHVCVHGIRWDAVPSFRWVADAVMLVRTAGALIDWDRLVAQARRCELVLPLADALTIASRVVQLHVPPDVIDALRRTPTSRWARVEHAVRLRAPGLGGTLPRHLCQYWRRTRRVGTLRAVLGVPRYLQRAYGLADLRELPTTLLGKLRRQLRRTFDSH